MSTVPGALTPATSIWIIGAGDGIGQALASAYAGRGHRLVLSARGADKLERLARSLPGTHMVLPFDVSDPTAVAQAIAMLPQVDKILFLAGVYEPMPLRELDIELCRSIIDTNLMGALYLIHALLPVIRQRKRRVQVAFCASVAGFCGLPNSQPYAASKAGLISLVESLRAETPDNLLDIRLINPGFVKTRLTERNTFPMPFLQTPEQAASKIIKGLESSRFEIHFPKRLTVPVKLLSLLPYRVYFALTRRLDRRT